MAHDGELPRTTIKYFRYAKIELLTNNMSQRKRFNIIKDNDVMAGSYDVTKT